MVIAGSVWWGWYRRTLRPQPPPYIPNPVRPENFPTFLQVPDKAIYVDYVISTDGELATVSFRVGDLFPAEQTLGEVARDLEEAGFKALAYDLLNPTLRSSHTRGWSKWVDATDDPAVWVHHWLAAWANDQHEVVQISLRYDYPVDGEADLNNLWAVCMYEAGQGLFGQALSRYRQMHPSE
ncbi:MAG: hypothetical protein KKB50_08060 [Planctomycetes bacterium]|nr:hypothetical protein [Planctomycetota bacterium]